MRREALCTSERLLARLCLVLCVLVSACASRMTMPERALEWQRAPDRQEQGKKWFREVAHLRGVHADDDLQLGQVFASPDGTVIASNCPHFPREATDGRTLDRNEIVVEHGVAIWHPDQGANATWVAFPDADRDSPWSMYGPLCFSSDGSRLVAGCGTSLFVISTAEARMIGRVDPLGTIPSDKGTYSHIDWRHVAFSEDGTSLSAQVMADAACMEDGTCIAAAARAAWSIPSGDLIAIEPLGTISVRQRPEYTLYVDYVPMSDLFLSSSRPVRSEDARFVAISFKGFGRFLGIADTTPAHIRVWDAQTSTLIAWGYPTNKDHLPHPVAFLARPASMLYCDDDGVSVVDLDRRTEIAQWPWPRRSHAYLWNATWIASRQTLCVPDARTVRLIQLTPPAP